MGSLRVLTRIFHTQEKTTDYPPSLSELPKQVSSKPRKTRKPPKQPTKNNKTPKKPKRSTKLQTSPDKKSLKKEHYLDVSFDSADLSSEDSLYDITQAPVTPSTQDKSPQTGKPKEIQWQMGGLVGTGSFGTVRMGLNIKTGELIAVKQVPLMDDGTSSSQVESLQREIEILSTLRHHNIVRYLGTGREEHMLNIFLEYITGGSIQSLLGKMGPFPEEVIAMYTKQILHGLEYLHQNNIVHRDIKGGNILVSNDGVIKLADFGASKKLEGVANPTGKGSLKGTVFWMAPEVARQESCGKEADIWSLGCTVYEMATGSPPWSEYPDQVSALFHIASTKSPPSLKNLNLSPIALDFLRVCLKLSPSKRPSAKQLLYHPFLSHTPSSSHKQSGAPPKNSYSTPDYGQDPSSSSMLRQASKLQKHRRNPSVDLDLDISSSDGALPLTGERTSKPVASPFVFLQRSNETKKVSKKVKFINKL